MPIIPLTATRKITQTNKKNWSFALRFLFVLAALVLAAADAHTNTAQD
jgi:hypothetical protein